MPQTYRFQVSIPVDSALPRDRVTNVLHLQHSIGALADTDLESMCSDIIGVYQARYFVTNREINCKAYDVDAAPNYPRADVSVNLGVQWAAGSPREVALCLSYYGDHPGNKSERGRMYLAPYLRDSAPNIGLRPDANWMDWALDWYTEPNESLPDLGGVDWKFGVYSRTYSKFTQTQHAWVNDEWDTQRRRGLRETTRQQATREG